VGFKLHANRGIGRYASEPGSRLLGDSYPPAHPGVTIAPFRQPALLTGLFRNYSLGHDRACHDEAWGCAYSRVWWAYQEVIRQVA
jgi:hypothetical protein